MQIIEDMNTVKETFKRYFQFRGRSDRREFWTWVLALLVVSVPVVCILALTAFLFGNTTGHTVAEGAFNAIIILLGLFWLVMFLPSLTVSVRRLRDAGIAPWLLLVPAALGTFTMLVLMDRALYNMSPTTPANWSGAFAVILTLVTALTGIAFLILFCLPSKKN